MSKTVAAGAVPEGFAGFVVADIVLVAVDIVLVVVGIVLAGIDLVAAGLVVVVGAFRPLLVAWGSWDQVPAHLARPFGCHQNPC